jgi:ATP-dependent helicase IRC3
VRFLRFELEEFADLSLTVRTAGSGKTSIFTRLISILPPLQPPKTQELATRVLIIVNSIQLVHQTHLAISRAYPDWHVEIEQGSKKASGHADVTIATFQTLGRDGGKRLDKFETEYYKAVIIDEVSSELPWEAHP